MDPSLPYRLAVVGVFVAMRLSRLPVRRRVGWRANWPGMKRNPLDTAILLVWSVALLPMLVLYVAFPGRIAWCEVPLPGVLRWAGLGVSLLGLTLLIWADRTLGKNLSVTLQIVPRHELVTSGPYRRVRHPIYSAGLLVLGGVSLLSANALVATVCLGGYLLLLATRIPREERMLATHFGAAYEVYRRQTGRLLPRWRAFCRE